MRYKKEMLEDQRVVGLIASTLKSSRIQRKLTVKRLSRITGLTQQTIANIELGDGARVDLVKIHRLAKAMNLSVMDVFGRIDMFSSKDENNSSQCDGLESISFENEFSSGMPGLFSNPDYMKPTQPFISKNEVHIALEGTTLETWFFPMDPARRGEQKIMTLFPDFGDEVYIGWEDERIWFGIIPGDEDAWMRLRSGPISLFEWHHVVVVCNGNFASLYIDQVEIGQMSIRNFSSYSLSNKIYIGCVGYETCQKSNELDRFFMGKIDQPGIWTEPLSPLKIKENRMKLGEDFIENNRRWSPIMA